MAAVHKIAAQGFQNQTAAYERGRPSYPDSALKWVFGQQIKSPVHTLIDLGSGTGKFTRLLKPYAHKGSDQCIFVQLAPITWKANRFLVIAVEPVEGMRKKFAELSPDIPVLEGGADKLPFENNSIDVICAAQAFHWFANMNSLREIHRVLKNGGHFVMIWNLEDRNRADWVAALRDAYEEFEAGTPQYRHMLWRQVWKEDNGKLFAPLVESHFSNDIEGATAQSIWDRILSKSYISCLSTEQQAALKKRVDQILKEKLPQFAQNFDEAKVLYPYTTDVVIAQKLPLSNN